MVDQTDDVQDTGAGTDRLELRVPGTPTHLPVVRAMAGDLAMRMDFDLDAVEDLRLAVDEACATLVQIAVPATPLTVVFQVTRRGLHIDAWVRTVPGTTVRGDGFGWAVLQTLVDAVEAGAGTPADAPAGDDGGDGPVAVISLDKDLPARQTNVVENAGHDTSVAR